MDDPTKPADSAQAPGGPAPEQKQTKRGRLVAGAVAVGAILLEPELLPGIAIGLAIAAAPKLGPRVIGYLRPVVQKAQTMASTALDRGREIGQKVKARVMPAPRGVAAPSHEPGPTR